MNNVKIVILSVCIFIIILSLFIFIDLKLRKKNNEENTIEESSTIIADNDDNKNITKNNETYNNEIKGDILKQTTEAYDYFLLEYCISKFYNYDSYQDNFLDLIDEDVVKKLKLKDNNFINNISKGYCIDEIYKQKVKENENIYVVYYRLGVDTLKCEKYTLWVRVNSKNKVFSIYPYEYLNTNNLTNLKAEDSVIDSFSEILRKPDNTYTEEEIVVNEKIYMLELFARYKFDLLMDREHLYNSLNKKYREEKFQNIENLQKYIEENRTKLYVESIDKYGVNKYETYKEFVGKGVSGKIYIFIMKNIMDYELTFDDYTVTLKNQLELYNDSLPNVQTEYCISRIIRAINNKDYDFVYDKLHPVQKSNYYSNKDDFINFLKNYFWEQNIYEVVNTYMLSPNEVQYKIRLTDGGGLPVFRSYIVTVTLRNGDDFFIAIRKD